MAAPAPRPRCACLGRGHGRAGRLLHEQYEGGNRGVIGPLALEEANLLHARRAARRHGWWGRVTSAMQGLRVLYEYQGRTPNGRGWWRRSSPTTARRRMAPSPAGKTSIAWR